MDVNGLYNALVDWRTLTDALTTAQNSAAAKVGAPLRDSQWTGLAADKAYIGLNILADDLLYAASQARMISTVLTDMHGFFETMRNELRKLIDSAAGLYTVNDDGSVSYVEEVPSPGANQSVLDNIEAENTTRRNAAAAVAWLMQSVADADKKFADTLRLLNVAPGRHVHLATWRDNAQDAQAVSAMTTLDLAAIPRDNPQAAAAWWAGLSLAQQQEYLALAPQVVGATDGLPAAVRDQANRTVLKQEIADLQHKFDLTKGTAARSEWPVELRSAQDWHRERDRLDAMLLLQSKIDYRMTAEENPYGQAVPPMYLLGYDNSGAGKAIVAVGNPDTADNVVINVPGQGANLAGVDDYIDRAAAVQGAAVDADPTRTTSSVMWLGYEAPQNFLLDASRTEAADHGAPKLTRFDTGLDAARQGPPAHTTVVAHSYGGLVAGRALEREGMQVDEFVVLGGVGVGPDHVSALNMPPEHVYAGTAPNDPVPGWASSTDPTEWFSGDGDHRFGKDPTSEDFGARELPVDYAPGGSDAFNWDAHRSYWTYGSSSLEAIGRVAAGGEP
ncbi:alpha/beta hydrolase family protein [Streptomycetaceae bacterium NBC_01309]